MYRKVDSSVKMDCHALSCAKARNDDERALSLESTFSLVAFFLSLHSALAECIFSVAPQGATSSRPLRGAKKRDKGG